MTYGGYLTLEPLLSAQHPISDHHDELLFIIIHQTKELWLKQIIHELDVALGLVRGDRLIEVHKNLSRVSRIQAVMTLSWDVLATLTPTDYMQFRDVLGASSGFQSAQFRQFEFLLGLKDGGHLQIPGGGLGRSMARSPRRSTAPSLWDEANAALARGRLRRAGRGAGAGLEPALPAQARRRGRLGRRLSRHRAMVALLPVRRETGRHRRRDGGLAPQACR